MAQPYDKTGAMGKKTLLSQEDLQKTGNGIGEMLFWEFIHQLVFSFLVMIYGCSGVGLLMEGKALCTSYCGTMLEWVEAVDLKVLNFARWLNLWISAQWIFSSSCRWSFNSTSYPYRSCTIIFKSITKNSMYISTTS